MAWYDGNSNSSTHPIGGKNSNELGLYDMSGNVREWCEDGYEAYDSYPVKNPKGAESETACVLRGCSWYSYYCGVTKRDFTNPEYRNYSLGFRLAQ